MPNKRGRKPFVAMEHIKDFNNVKISLLYSSFTEDKLRKKLKENGIISGKMFISEFVKYGMLSKDYYTGTLRFTDTKPVHYTTLHEVYMNYLETTSKYENNRATKKSKDFRDSEINAAIQLLKSAGYEVFSPVGDLYSKM